MGMFHKKVGFIMSIGANIKFFRENAGLNQEFSKTHVERYIPVSKKLKKILTNDEMEKAKRTMCCFSEFR